MRSEIVLVIQGASSPDDIPGLARVSGTVSLRAAPTVQSLKEALPGADALLGWDFRASDLRTAWGASERLRWIHWAGAGVDAALFPELVQSDVVLTNSQGVFDGAMAEYILGLIIAFAKDFAETFALQSQRRWHHRLGERLAGRRVLVVGAGSIGRATARMLRCAGMRVSGVARRSRHADPDFDAVHGREDLNGTLADADFVVLTVPLTDLTVHLFDAEQFRCMKPGARLINVGRGALVREQALIEALQRGHIAGAALDVFAAEPLPADSPLWTLPNVIVSPHMSGDFVGYPEALAALFLDNLERYRHGRPLLNVVDKALGYIPS